MLPSALVSLLMVISKINNMHPHPTHSLCFVHYVAADLYDDIFLHSWGITHVYGWHKRLLFLCSSPAQVNVTTEISYCFIFTEHWEHTFGYLHWELPHKILILKQFLMIPLPVSWKVFKGMSYPNSRMVSSWVRSYIKSLVLYAMEQPAFLWALHWHPILLVWETAGVTSGGFEITLICFDPASYPNSKTSIAVQKQISLLD